MNNPNLSIDTDRTIQILTDFIKSKLAEAGFSRAVIGLSGGIDSALSCALTVKAIGAENVLSVRMPYKTSSQVSLTHAQLLIEKLGVPSLTIPITEMADAFIALDPKMSKIRRGNIMARCRMIVLYDQSEAFGGLVMGTGNKTEILLGYTTIYGDSAAAINPIGDLYKTQVRQLARALGVPEEIINKSPSADLWTNQTDEDELGFSYDEVDRLFYLLVEHRYSMKELADAGFEESFVRNVVKRVRQNQFKRELPPIAEVSGRTVDYSFLYFDN
ncbi:MAG TPA: NAD+ synthase [Anaerolineales bacterium]|nr:NAD+ synthase [Anaerolineales bacterium]